MARTADRLRSTIACRARDERGTTLVELLVAMLLFGMVGTVAFTSFSSISTTTKRVDDRGIALVETRQALEVMIRDMRAADPIDPQTPVSLYDTSVGFNVHCSQPGVNGCGSNRLRPIRYTFANEGLQRVAGTTTTFIGPSGPDNLPRPLQRSAIVNDPVTQPVFTYYDKNGARIRTREPGAVASTDFQNCARRVEVHLIVQAEAGNPSSRVDLRTTINLRNYHEVTQCAPTATTTSTP